jgi:uncharacterized protein (TIGR03067 family)
MMDDFESLQGFWKLETGTRNGVPDPYEESGTLFQFTGHRFRQIRTRLSSRFELHPDTEPKGIDFVQVSMRMRSLCIYDLDGDTLRILRASGKNSRPSSFDEPGCLLQVYSRFKRRINVKRRVRAQIPPAVDLKALGVAYKHGEWVERK